MENPSLEAFQIHPFTKPWLAPRAPFELGDHDVEEGQVYNFQKNSIAAYFLQSYCRLHTLPVFVIL